MTREELLKKLDENGNTGADLSPGDSSGADAEVRYAQNLGLPIFYSVEALQAAFPEVLP